MPEENSQDYENPNEVANKGTKEEEEEGYDEIKIDPEDIFASWQINENDYHKKSPRWFLIFGAIFIALFIYSLFTGNFFFAVILIITVVITISKNSQEPELLNIILSHKGIKLGKKFYDFDRLKNFSIIYKPDKDTKTLIFEFKNPLLPEIIIPLGETNPLLVRENLIKYMEEDLDKDDVPMYENLNKLLKL